VGGYSVRIEGLGEFRRAIRRGSERARSEAQRALGATVIEAEGEIKAATPVRTGRLRASITHEVRGLTGVVGTNVEYAPYVEFGTVKMAPRRMFAVGIERAWPKVQQIWQEAMARLWER
jgi:HK97 gp10 family phage protein